MRGFSKAIIVGNVTRDPELRTTPNGAQVCSFSVAINRVFRDANGNAQEQVSYLDCVAWGRQGETIAQYIKKGNGILVSGRLEQRSWEDKQTNQKRYRTEIVVEDFNFIGGRDANGGNATSNNGSYSNYSGNNGGFTNNAPAPGSSTPSPNANGDITPEDVPEGEVDLNDIPF